MDEIGLFAELRPAPPADTAQMRLKVGRRLDAALTSPGSPHRARAPRTRRRAARLAAAAAAAAAAIAIAVPAMLLGATGTAPAWAVQHGPRGTIIVTVTRAFHGQAGLQRALRADGVPAYARSLARCVWIPPGGIKKIRDDPAALTTGSRRTAGLGVFIIHPAEIPKGWAVLIAGIRFRRGLAFQYYLMPSRHQPVCHPGVLNVGPSLGMALNRRRDMQITGSGPGPRRGRSQTAGTSSQVSSTAAVVSGIRWNGSLAGVMPTRPFGSMHRTGTSAASTICMPTELPGIQNRRSGASVSKRAITFSDSASAFAERTLSLIWTAADR